MAARKRRMGEHASRPPVAQRAGRAARAPRRSAEPSILRVAGLLFCGLLVIYVANFRMLSAGDSLPTRVLPFSLLREGNLNVDEFDWPPRSDGRLPYYVHSVGKHHYSVSTIATAIVVTPLYIVPAAWMAANGVGYNDVRARVVMVIMERFSAAVLTALSATVLFVALRRLTTWRWALMLALVYGLGTSTWSISSQALWAHGLSELCLAIICLILLAPAPSAASFVVAGLAAAAMVANRPQTITFAALALAFVFVHHRRYVLAFAALPALVGVLLVTYNRAIFHNIAGGYGAGNPFRGSLVDGVMGMLISPNRGLLVYTPIMAFALWGAVRVWRVPTPPWLRWLTIGVLLHVLVHGKFKEWWAGYTYGPRYFVDVLPALALFLVYGLVPLCRSEFMRVVAAVLVLYGVAVQAIGVYAADDRWNRDPLPLEVRPQRVWDWSDLQIARAWSNGLKPGELASIMFDAFRDPVPAQVAALTEDQLASTITIRGVPNTVVRGGTVRGVAQITNRADVAWPAFTGEGAIGSRYLVFLLVRWFSHGKPLAGTGDVLPVPENVAPGQTVEVPFELQVPNAPGPLELECRVSQAVDRIRGLASRDAERIPVVVK